MLASVTAYASAAAMREELTEQPVDVDQSSLLICPRYRSNANDIDCLAEIQPVEDVFEMTKK